jgi:hypothetical protein
VIRATRRFGIKVDIEDVRSIPHFQLSIRSKLMGQVNLVRVGMNHVAACAKAYVAAVEGKHNGQTLDARKFV